MTRHFVTEKKFSIGSAGALWVRVSDPLAVPGVQRMW
jgi:hypothetical protein